MMEMENEITGETSDGYHTFDELYQHRYALFAALAHTYGDKSWKSQKHQDGTMWDGWFVAGIELPTGQITYHLPVSVWMKFPAQEIERAPAWDGHTSNDVIHRIWTTLPYYDY